MILHEPLPVHIVGRLAAYYLNTLERMFFQKRNARKRSNNYIALESIKLQKNCQKQCH